MAAAVLQEGSFELQLIDLAAQRAAEAACASSMATASCAAAIAGQPDCHKAGSGRAGAATAVRATDSPEAEGATTAAAAAAVGSSEAEVLAAAAAAAAGCSTAGEPCIGSLPVLGTQGVLASVRVKDGKALGTLGYERQLRMQRRASVPRKVGAYMGLLSTALAAV